MSETEIRELWETVELVSDVISGKGTVLKVKAQGIIHSLLNVSDSVCHPLLRDTRLLKSSFTQVRIQYT